MKIQIIFLCTMLLTGQFTGLFSQTVTNIVFPSANEKPLRDPSISLG
jgi:hypothetical protein